MFVHIFESHVYEVITFIVTIIKPIVANICLVDNYFKFNQTFELVFRFNVKVREKCIRGASVDAHKCVAYAVT